MSKNARRIFSVAILCILTLSMCSASTIAANKEIKIGLSLPTMQHGLQRARAAQAVNAAMHHVDVRVIVTDARRDSLKQLADIESFIAQGVDIVLMCPNDSQALVQAATELKKAGIPLITFDRSLSCDDVLCHVGVDNVEVGRKVGRFVEEQLNGKGKIIMIEGQPGASATIERRDGFMEIMKQAPGLELILDQTAQYQRHLALGVMENALLAHSHIDAVYCHNDEMALGASVAVANAGRTKEMLIIGVDGQKEMLKGVLDGTVTATVVTPTLFPQVFDVAMQVLNGESVPQKIVIDAPLVTKENVEQYYDPDSIF